MVLENFMVDSHTVLNKITDLALFEHGVKHYEYGDDVEQMRSAARFYNIQLGNYEQSAANGSELHDSIPLNAPKVGLSTSLFWEYYKNDKTDFEKVCLLAHLAIKSILQKKPFCKITNNYLLARMDGKAKAVEDITGLSPEIRKYANEYQLKKIKTELILNWNLTHYSRYTRGFYVSLSMSLDDLVFQAEKRRKSRLKKKLDNDQKAAIQRAIQKLNNL